MVLAPTWIELTREVEGKYGEEIYYRGTFTPPVNFPYKPIDKFSG
jgi:hypothetical protein